MKKLPYLKQLMAVFCLVTCLQNAVFSQEKKKKVLFGVYGGVNVNKISPPPLKSFWQYFGSTYKWTPSYNFGGFIDCYFAKRLYIESGANVLLRKSNTSPRVTNSLTFSTYYDGAKDYTLYFYNKFNHEILAIQIPLALHIDIVKIKNFRTNIYAGLIFEQALRYDVKETRSIKWEPVIPTQDVLDNANKYIYNSEGGTFEGVNKTTYGGMIGVGVNYRRIGIDINYNGTERTFQSGPGVIHYKMPSFMMNLRFQLN